MKTLLRKILTLTILLCTTLVAWAEEKISFKANAELIATMGEGFRVSFDLNARPDSNTFEAPSFENFDVIAGPSVSQGSSIQIINGRQTSSVSYSTTYVLLPQKEGTFTIGSASVEVKGKRYTSQPIDIEVRKGRNSGSQQSQEHSGENAASSRIEKEDLILRFDISKSSVYKGEPVRAILKLYSRVAIAGSEHAKWPTFNGFWSQKVDIEQGPFRETLNNKVYEVYNLAEYLLYPQKDGSITIEPAEMTVVAQVVVQSNFPIDPFFGGGHQVYNVRRELKTEPITIYVKPLPAGAPASFAGAVGRYTLAHKLSATEVAANSAVTLQLKISGTGNLQFISAPSVTLPESFERYEVKSEEHIENRASGSVGYRSFDYPFIVRAEGDYDLPNVEFSYFDVDKREYITLSTPPMKIVVTPDKNSSSAQQTVVAGPSRENVKLLGEDIRFIMLGKANLRSVVAPLVLSQTYWLIMLSLLAIAIVAFFIIRKYIHDNSNVVLVKGKRANKTAIQRFRVAEKYKREQDRRAFYEEMLRAMWGYLSDKFNIPVADLTREVVRKLLSARGAEAEAEGIIAVIARCEEAQYSPATSVEMNEIYEDGVEAVSKIESATKK